jgi:hypothetical protein
MPRTTRLLRVRGLRGLQQTIALAADSSSPDRLRDTLIVVPTSGAVDQLQRTLEALWLTVRAWPQIVTRSGLYGCFSERLDEPPRLLDDYAREVLFQRAAADAIARGDAPPFDVRPGLVPEMLALYDALRRQHRQVDDFERLVGGALESGAEIDRGARRLLQQTRFLVSAFRAYETRLDHAEALDEHGLRRRLLDQPADCPVRHVIVTVPDHRADAAGLWPADFDLLTRLAGLDAIDVVATETLLATGFLERLQDILPGIQMHAAAEIEAEPPRLLAPPDGPQDPLHFTSRDREQELADVASRLVRARDAQRGAAGAEEPSFDRMAVVYQRPLPYLYLARQVFGAYELPWQAFDALPLAAEPDAAALDLVLTFALSGYTRATAIALLRAPQFRFEVDGHEPTLDEIAACDAELRDAGFLGGRDRLLALVDDWRLDRGRLRPRAMRALAALVSAADALAPLEAEALPSAHLDTLHRFLDTYQQREAIASPDRALQAVTESLNARHLRASAAVLGAISGLRAAFLEHGEREGPFRDLTALIHRWLEGQTFNPRVGEHGVHLVDAQAAMYGCFTHVAIVGVVEGEWPASSSRNIFYPSSLLRDLGWPTEPERRAATRAAFEDLVGLARDEASVSVFALEHDAIVRPSAFVEDLAGAGLRVERLVETSEVSRSAAGQGPSARADVEGRLLAVPALTVEPGEAAAWAALRRTRSPHEAPAFHGFTAPREPRSYSVTSLDRYLQCPFKYFADSVLKLDEELDRRPGLTPLERGRFEHEVFQIFFARWDAAGRGAIDRSSLEPAREEFATVVDEVLARLPASERALERTRLLGSAANAGLGERVFRFEAARHAPIARRLLEYALDGEYTLTIPEGATRLVRLRGTADRIDLLADGTMRVIDYKTGKASSAASSIQLPVYAHCAEERLEAFGGRQWRVSEAGYLALGRQEPFVTVVSAADGTQKKIAPAIARVVGVVERIEEGAFPVAPVEPYNCIFCGFAAVCRKDYVDDV